MLLFEASFDAVECREVGEIPRGGAERGPRNIAANSGSFETAQAKPRAPRSFRISHAASWIGSAASAPMNEPSGPWRPAAVWASENSKRRAERSSRHGAPTGASTDSEGSATTRGG